MFVLLQTLSRKTKWKIKGKIFNTYWSSNHDNNQFILFLWKNVYPYEYIDDWEKFNKKLLPEKEGFFTVT